MNNNNEFLSLHAVSKSQLYSTKSILSKIAFLTAITANKIYALLNKVTINLLYLTIYEPAHE